MFSHRNLLFSTAFLLAVFNPLLLQPFFVARKAMQSRGETDINLNLWRRLQNNMGGIEVSIVEEMKPRQSTFSFWLFYFLHIRRDIQCKCS